jgi:hypothetical protein
VTTEFVNVGHPYYRHFDTYEKTWNQSAANIASAWDFEEATKPPMQRGLTKISRAALSFTD